MREHLKKVKKHHVVLGGVSTVVVIYIIISAILLNGIIVKQTIDKNNLNNKIDGLEADTQSKLNELTESLIETQGSLDLQEAEFENLKSSAGEDFSEIIQSSFKSVVTIRTNVAQGTGFIISNEGYIVTNAHVLSKANAVEAITHNQDRISATYIGYNPELDLALLKVEGEFNYLEFGNSDKTEIGERVIAIGNPLGLTFSVSEGIVSGVHRAGANKVEAYVQTDAALNPGNSGGPLIDKEGQVIGINNFKLANGESLGFALESNYVKNAINEISQEELEKNILG